MADRPTDRQDRDAKDGVILVIGAGLSEDGGCREIATKQLFLSQHRTYTAPHRRKGRIVSCVPAWWTGQRRGGATLTTETGLEYALRSTTRKLVFAVVALE